MNKQLIKLTLFISIALPAAQAFAIDDLPPVNSAKFAEHMDKAEHDLMILDNRLSAAESRVRSIKNTMEIQGDWYISRYGVREQLAEANAELAKAQADLRARFSDDIINIRNKMWEARNRHSEVIKYGGQNDTALADTRKAYNEAKKDFLRSWKSNPKLASKIKIGRYGMLGVAAAAAPLAVEAVMGSSAEASELNQIDFKAPEAQETERTPVEISTTLED